MLGQVLNSWWPYLFDINRFDTPFLPNIDILSAPPDTVPPASPGNARGIGTGPRTTRIEWDQPEDDVGVTRYEVYRDGQLLQQTPLRYFIDEHLAPETTYSYQVRARDGSGNVSLPSSALLVSTLSPGIQLWNGDFEQGLATPVRWQPDAFHQSAVFVWDMPGTGREATRCVRIEAVEPNDARWMQEVTGLVPEGVYRLSGWIKGERILLESGAFAGANLCAMGTWDHSEPPLTGTFDWTRVEVQVRASAAGRLTVGCRLGYWSSLARGVAWFDDITLELVMDPRNRPPEANDDVLMAIQDTPIHVSVLELLANDTDPDDDSLSLTAVSPTSLEGGIVVLEKQELCFTPRPPGLSAPTVLPTPLVTVAEALHRALCSSRWTRL